MLKSIIKRTLSGFLAICIAFGALVSISVLPSYAADEPDTTIGFKAEDVLNTKFQYPQEKLKKMKKVQTKGDYELYVLEGSGEVAVKNVKTDQIMFTNPFDVGGETFSNKDKYTVLSQILLTFTDVKSGKQEKWNSFEQAAMRNQISMSYLKTGIRIDYIMGKQDTRRLVPMLITKERFETKILNPILEGLQEVKTPEELASIRKKFMSAFILSDFNVPEGEEDVWVPIYDQQIELYFKGTQVEKAWKNSKYKKKDSTSMPMAVYKVNDNETEIFLNYLESYIKSKTTYSFNDQAEDYEITGYDMKLKTSPLFKLAIEYYLQEDGSLQVRVPANSLVFDESAYMVDSITILPFMGAGSNQYEGYTFIPDGSGSLVRFEDVAGSSYTMVGQIFGQDFAYHTLSPSFNGKHEIMRYPVYGIIEDLGKKRDRNAATEDEFTLPNGETVTNLITTTEKPVTTDSDTGTDTDEETTATETEPNKPTVVAGTQKRGFVAIIEEGVSLAEITSSHSSIHKYNAVYNTFYPRPSDKYNLRDAISIGQNAEWTVTSERKYTGSYRIKYIMLLTNSEGATNSSGVPLENSKYQASYSGMAEAYRDYLIEHGVLKKLPVTDKGIPLYIETFGAIDVQDTFLSIPIWKKAALTSFDNLKTMYDELESKNIKNVIFRLTGYTNGGLNHTVPYKVKFEKVVGGNKGYEDFVNYATEKGIGVYADFDFAYQQKTSAFDGFSFKKHALQTIDGRFQIKKEYYPTIQEFSSTGLLAISPSVYKTYFKNFIKNFSKIIDPSKVGISVSTLGSDLNSDFNEDKPRNREDTRKLTEEMLANLEGRFSGVMIDGGNSYAYRYVDHILNMSLEGSRTFKAGGSVPFLAMTLHGYINYAGSPTNMSSSIAYEMLRIIESGASPYFLLSYQNTSALKESRAYSKYYSVQYDIWLEDIVTSYNTLNEALKDVQFATYTSHEFLYGERIPDSNEIESALAKVEATFKESSDKMDSAIVNMTRAKALYDRLKASGTSTASEDARKDYENTQTEYRQAREAYIKALNEYNKLTLRSVVYSYRRAEIDLHNAEVAFEEAQRIYNKLVEANADSKDLRDAKAEVDAAQAVLDQATAALAVEKPKYDALVEQYGIDTVKAAYTRYNKTGEYVKTLYTTKSDTVVKTTYDNGISFILNFNNFDITVETDGNVYTIPAYGFLKLN